MSSPDRTSRLIDDWIGESENKASKETLSDLARLNGMDKTVSLSSQEGGKIMKRLRKTDFPFNVVKPSSGAVAYVGTKVDLSSLQKDLEEEGYYISNESQVDGDDVYLFEHFDKQVSPILGRFPDESKHEGFLYLNE